MQYQSITYSVKHFNCQFHQVLIKLHILISLLYIWVKTILYIYNMYWPKNYFKFWNKGKCLSLWFLGTGITCALLCHCLLCLSPLTPAWNNFLLLRKSLLGIPHGRSRWMWASGQTYKERRRKRNNNKLNCVWTTNASQVSWIFAMNLKLNWSSLYYWQQDMLIVLIICAVFHGATLMNNS